MKKKILLIALLAICLSIVAFGTLAYFTSEDTAHNVITSNGVKIELLEWQDDAKTEPFPENGVTGVMPGTKVAKIVEVKNTGSGEAWVRVSTETAITLANGSQGEVDLSLLTIDFNIEAWTEQDGWYYYNEALKPGEITAPLFTTVAFAETMDNRYQESTATVDVNAQAVQTANNGSDAISAVGWPEA